MVDIWALGCFAYELAEGIRPHDTITDKKKLLSKIINEPIPRISSERWSADFQNLIDVCTSKNPKERLTIDQLLNQHRFFKDINE